MLALQALATGSQSIRLLWAGQAGVTTYKVLRSATSTPGPQVGTVTAGVGVFNDHNDPTGLTPATTYFYWLADQNNTLLTAPTAVQTMAQPVKAGLVQTVQDAISAWASTASGLPNGQVIWKDQEADKPLKPFILLSAFGPMPGVIAQYREQDNEALGALEGYTVQVQCINDPPDSTGTIRDVFQMAADLLHSLDDPGVASAFNDAGIGTGTVQGITDLSAVLETKFEQRAMLEFMVNVGSSFPITVPYTIDTVAPPVGTVSN
jgi:hypothetical protein